MQLKQKLTGLLQKAISYSLILAVLVLNSPIPTQAANLATGVDTLGDSAVAVSSTHSIAFTTQTNLSTGDRIELYFPDFTVNLADNTDISVATGPTTANPTYSNLDKKITLTLTEDFAAGDVVVEIANERISSPIVEGEYSIGLLTRDASNGFAVLDSGIATAGVANSINFSVTVYPTGNWFVITTPELQKVEIVDSAGVTSDTTPLIRITATNTPSFLALSCNGGGIWSSWISFPDDGELNTGNDTNFDITTGAGCDTAEGSKTITVKLKNNYGYESAWLSDSTIYQIAEATHPAATTPTTDITTPVTPDTPTTPTTPTVIQPEATTKTVLPEDEASIESIEQISRITAGPSSQQRDSWNSEKWISPADTGGDEIVSFAWNSTGENFAYELDLNPNANSVTEDSPATTKRFVDDLKLTEGSNYFHLQVINSDDTRSAEKVFVLNYDKTPPRLLNAQIEIPTENFEVGDKINFTLHFSEPISTPGILTAYFSFGSVVEIPAITTPVDFVSGSFILKNTNDSFKDALTSLVGMIIDRAGLIAINPTPTESEITLANGGINNPRLIVKNPAVAAGGKYFTTSNQITLLPLAEGATQMRINSESLASNAEMKLGAWIPYSQSEIKLDITPDLGAKKITVDFTNEAGSTRSAGTIITRIPASTEELIAAEKVWEGLAKIMRGKAIVRLEALIAEGLSKTYSELAEENPNFNPTIIDKVSIADLNAALDIVEEIKTIAASEDFALQALGNALDRLVDLGCKLTDFFNPEEINYLLTKLDADNLDGLKQYIDLNTATIQQDAAGNILVTGKSLGLRDSDGDGLSDRKELFLATDPYNADSDQDGWDDGEEVLDFGSNPLSVDTEMTAGFSNLRDGSVLADPRPILRGSATPGNKLSITATNEKQENLTLGNTTADESGKWLLIPEVVLPSGKYTFQLADISAKKLLAVATVEINLDFILLPPELYLDSASLILGNSQPEFYGNTFYGNTVVATFQSEIGSSAIIADNASGDFVIRPPKPLEAGKHTLTIYSEMSDGTRSPARIINFEITGATHSAAPILHLPSTEDAVLGSIVVAAICGAFYFMSRRHETEV